MRTLAQRRICIIVVATGLACCGRHSGASDAGAMEGEPDAGEAGDAGADAGPTGVDAGGYSYAGCPAADYGCPRLLTLHCALTSIADTYSSCAVDSDCVPAPLDPKCSGEGFCPPYLVADAGVADFKAQAQSEIDRYCALTPGCTVAPSCVNIPLRASCDAGRCLWSPADAG